MCLSVSLALFAACSTENGANTDRTGYSEPTEKPQTTEEITENTDYTDARKIGETTYIDPYKCEIDSAADTLTVTCEDGQQYVFNGSDSPEQQAKDVGALAREVLDSGRSLPRDTRSGMDVHFSGEYPRKIEYSTEWCISDQGDLLYDSAKIVTTNTVEVDGEGNAQLIPYGFSPKTFSSNLSEHTYRGVRIKLFYDSSTVEYFVMLDN